MLDEGIRQLGTAWRHYQHQNDTFENSEFKYSYQNTFHRGYILGDINSIASAPPEWPRIKVGAINLAASPALKVTSAQGNSHPYSVTILGKAFSTDRKLNNQTEIAHDLLNSLQSKGIAGIDERIEELGGRFVLVCQDEKTCRIFVDPMASLSAYYTKKDGRLVVSSHSALVAEAVDNLSSEEKSWIMQHPDYESGGGKYLPGLIFPHDTCLTIFANHCLNVCLKDYSRKQVRVYPRKQLSQLSIEEATDIFINETRFQLESWLKDTKPTYLALTAGRDSRALLTVGLDLLQDYGVTCMTYHFFEKNNPFTLKDLKKANQLAEKSRLPFKLVDIPPALTGKSMAKLYNTTFPTWARFPTLASAFYHQLAADSNLIIGIGGGIGTGFFRKREGATIDARTLAKKFSNSKVQNDPKLIATMQDYIELTEFSESAINGFNFYDVFHWEHRLSKWASIGYSEYDLSTSTALPMNSRRMIEAMLSVPESDQFSKAIYEALATRSKIY